MHAEVYIQGKGKISLSAKDFLAQGGQGAVYSKADTAYKVYLDPTKMIPPAKITELSAISNPKIIRPQDILLDKKGTPIGYTMRFIKNTYALCQLFPKAFRDRQHITPDMMLRLVQDMQASVKSVHQAGILIVDLNEMNWLVDDKCTEVYGIDVDSYQTRNFPATVLMESVRDRHCKNNKFSEGTDWFAFAITSFQMFIGIHPYKGRHPSVDSLDDRMLQNISVLNPKVSFPKVCLPFSVIPAAYLQWYKAVLEKGERVPPPDSAQAVLFVATVTRVKGSQNFEIKEVFTLPESIVDHVLINSVQVTLTTKALYVKGKKIADAHQGAHIGVTPKTTHVLLGSLENGIMEVFDATAGSKLPLYLNAEAMMSYDGRFYFKNAGHIYEIEFAETATRIIPTAIGVANVHQNSTKLYDGVAIQNLFGKYYASIFPMTKQHFEIQIKEVEGQIVDAKFERNILMIVANKGGKYNRYVLRFAADYGSYDLKIEKDIQYVGLNFVVLDNGVCCFLNEKDEIELFRNKKDDPMVKVVADNQINGDLKLFKEGTTVMFSKDDTLYTMTMKK
jgi:hypothetical protein